MSGEFGTENLKKCLAVIVESGNVAGDIVAMGPSAKWYQKVALCANVLDEIFDLTKVDFKVVIPELKDIDESEKTDLIEWGKEKFDIPQDEVEAVIEEGLGILMVNINAIQKDIEFAKKIKDLKKK